MKYIRTKDRIWQDSVPNQEKETQLLFNAYKHGLGYECKVADTIKELCDEFVVVSTNKKHTILPSNSFIDIVGTTCYGAIYVKGKGLIYVAKMNEKGELELL